MTNLERIYAMRVASVYPLYIAKAERKGRTKAEVDEIIRWLTGYTAKGLEAQLKKEASFETFFAKAPTARALNRKPHSAHGDCWGEPTGTPYFRSTISCSRA
jgi:hypothetical protein